MDRGQFDALTRWIFARQSRRTGLVTLLGAALLGLPFATVTAKPHGKGRGKKPNRQRARQDRARHDDRDLGTERGKGSQTKRRQKKRKQRKRDQATAGQCCSRGSCTPGKGKNLDSCCFQDQDLTARNFQGANLGRANFARADLTAATFSGANLDQTCFVDANLTAAKLGGANRGRAIFCRSELSSDIDNSGCDRGTPCCPTCDAAHPCDPGEVCCDGRCVRGECCDGSSCPANETCQGGECVCPCPLGCASDAVQAAIDAADAGATIQLCPGTYGAIVITKNLTLIGAGDGTDPASNTILDAAGNGTVVDVGLDVTVSLERLRITGGNSGAAAGIDNVGNLTLTACTVAQNKSIDSGGAIFNNVFGTIVLTDCTVMGNTANAGGGIYQTGSGAITLDNTTVRLNTADLNGGGIRVNSGVVNVTNGSTITENTAADRGGGIFVSPGGTAIFDGSGGVTENTAQGGGGGIYNSTGTVTLNGTPVSDNTPNNCAGSAVAGCSG